MEGVLEVRLGCTCGSLHDFLEFIFGLSQRSSPFMSLEKKSAAKYGWAKIACGFSRFLHLEVGQCGDLLKFPRGFLSRSIHAKGDITTYPLDAAHFLDVAFALSEPTSAWHSPLLNPRPRNAHFSPLPTASPLPRHCTQFPRQKALNTTNLEIKIRQS